MRHPVITNTASVRLPRPCAPQPCLRIVAKLACCPVATATLGVVVARHGVEGTKTVRLVLVQQPRISPNCPQQHALEKIDKEP